MTPEPSFSSETSLFLSFSSLLSSFFSSFLSTVSSSSSLYIERLCLSVVSKNDTSILYKKKIKRAWEKLLRLKPSYVKDICVCFPSLLMIVFLGSLWMSSLLYFTDYKVILSLLRFVTKREDQNNSSSFVFFFIFVLISLPSISIFLMLAPPWALLPRSYSCRPRV